MWKSSHILNPHHTSVGRFLVGHNTYQYENRASHTKRYTFFVFKFRSQMYCIISLVNTITTCYPVSCFKASGSSTFKARSRWLLTGPFVVEWIPWVFKTIGLWKWKFCHYILHPHTNQIHIRFLFQCNTKDSKVPDLIYFMTEVGRMLAYISRRVQPQIEKKTD